MERRLFDQSVPNRRGRRALTLPVSIALHVSVVGAALVLPLLGENVLPDVAAAAPRVFFTEPVIAAPVPPPPAAAPGRIRPTVARTTTAPTGFTAPPEIPDTLPPDDPGVGNATGSSPDGVYGGVGSGVPRDAIVGGLPPAAAIGSAPRRPGGDIRPPSKLHHVNPVYPALAQRVGLQGTVVIDCTIDPRGRVVNAQVVSGSQLLTDAAREAVMQWVYTPTLLNGVPIPILLNVTVVFGMR